MKASWYEKNGAASEVLIVGERPTPSPDAGEVLVRVHASGVNPSDVKSRAGRPLAGSYVTPHSDGAGVIEAVGAGVAESRVGERVWTWNAAWQRSDGTAAEYVVLPDEQAVILPDSASFEVGACAGIPLLTAIQGVELARGANAKSVLVIGAGSSVGHYITQLAKAAGMQVYATASQVRKQCVVEAGADFIIDYKKENIAERIKQETGGEGVDAILDMDFSSTVRLLPEGLLKPHGALLCYGSNDMAELSVPFRDLLFNSWSMKFFLVYDLTPDQRRIALNLACDWLANTGLLTQIDSKFALEDIAKAHERVESGKASGNVLLAI